MLYDSHGHPVLANEGVCLSFQQREPAHIHLYRGPEGLRRVSLPDRAEQTMPPDLADLKKLRWPNRQEQWFAPFNFVDANGQPNGCAELAVLFAECAGHRMEIIQGAGANGILYRLFGKKTPSFRAKDGRSINLEPGHLMRFNLERHSLAIIDGQRRDVKWANNDYERRVDWMDLTAVGRRDFLIETILAGTELHPQRLTKSDPEQLTYLLLSPVDD